MCNCDLDYIDLEYKARVWDTAIVEARDLGWLHESAVDDMLRRNPFRRAE